MERAATEGALATQVSEWVSAVTFDDLPPDFHGNVNTAEKPYDRKPGEQPALDEAEIADLVAFLKTLTDGYTPQ